VLILHRPAILLDELVAVRADDIGHLEKGSAHDARSFFRPSESSGLVTAPIGRWETRR
jgi:hypothetical protein